MSLCPKKECVASPLPIYPSTKSEVVWFMLSEDLSLRLSMPEQFPVFVAKS